MDNENGNYANLDAQLRGLIAGRIDHLADEKDYHDHLKNGLADLKASRDELWDAWKQHQQDTRNFAHALLTYEVPTVVAGELPVIPYLPPVAALPPPPTSNIRPPSPNPNAQAGLRRVAEMFAPPVVNGRPNQLARRVNQNG